MPHSPTRPEQTTREGLEQLAEVVASNEISLEEQVRRLQKEQLAVQAELIEIRRLIGSAVQRDEEHETRLERLEAESRRLEKALAEALARVDAAVADVKSGVQSVEDRTAQLARLVEGALKAFSWRWVVIALCWALGGAAMSAIQNYFKPSSAPVVTPVAPVAAPVGAVPTGSALRIG
jgi:uncharacterized protein (DUF3084 family)